MPLMEHLRELRSRLTKAILGIVLGTAVALYFYSPILDWLSQPYTDIRPELEAQGIKTDLVLTGVGGAFTFQLKIGLITGVVMSSPIWLWQLWAFVLPALHRHEKRSAIVLTAIGAPLFVAGAYGAYLVLPKAILLLIGFVPDGWGSLLTGAEYLNFVVRMVLVFGVAAEIPLVVTVLNRIGAVSAAQLAQFRPWTIIVIFVFAAVATPTTDPLTMLFLAAPMTILYGVAEVLARFTDRKRARTTEQLADDEISSLDD
jgi:sec-independent protein translocase protein TatC